MKYPYRSSSIRTVIIVLDFSQKGQQPEQQKMAGLYQKTTALFGVFILIHAAPAPLATEAPPSYVRLPEGIVPLYYALQLTVDLGQLNNQTPDPNPTFIGNVIIQIEVTKDGLEQIVLNGKDMTVNSATVKDLSNVEITLDVKDDPETDQVIFTGNGLKDLLKNGAKLELTIGYVGNHRDDTHGFYRSSYANETGGTRWLLATMFASSDARRAFPCYDEPHLKAMYTLTVKLPKADYEDGYTVLFNTPLAKPESEVNGYVTFEFQETPKKISSYLIAFIISDFKPTDAAIFKSDFDGNDIEKPFTTWGQSKFIDGKQGQVSQDAGVGALNVLTKKLGVGFGFPKIDQVGIPDFSAGAMENWGLTTYRERMLLFPEDGSESLKQSDVTVTTHELTHQWFGDLVTLKWWSDIWLNEGFARFFQYFAANEINNGEIDASKWNLIGQFVVNELQSIAFAADALPNSRPLHYERFTTPSEIDTLFDDISYSKGGSVIRMMAYAMGEARFYAALREYLIANAEGNADYTTLLASFDNQLKPEETVTFTERFSTWITEPGYPVVHVGKLQNSSYAITQKRFYLQRVKISKDEDLSNWHIPITYSTDKELQFTQTQPTVWLPRGEKSVLLTTEKQNESWIVVNNQESGYYRVNYDKELWMALRDVLVDEKNYKTIPEINRAQIVDDSLTLARSTNDDIQLDYEIAIDIVSYTVFETEYLPWRSALSAFSFLYAMLATPGNGLIFQMFVQFVISNMYETLGLAVNEKDSHLDRLQRIQIASWACKVELPKCEADTKKLFVDELDNDKKVNSDVRETVFCTGIGISGTDTWNRVWDMYLESTDNVEQTFLIAALGCSKNETLLKNFLAKTLEPNSPIRSQDFSSVFSSVYNGNPGNVPVALDFLVDNIEEIANTYIGLNPLGGLLTGIASKLNTKELVEQMEELAKAIQNSTNPKVNAAKDHAQAAVNIALSNQEWLDINAKSVKAIIQTKLAGRS